MPTTANRSVGIVAASGFVPEAAAIDRAAAFFAARGWKVEAGDSVFSRDLRFAGDDELRLADLQRFATDPNIALLVSARGGYGLSRLLDRIDFAAIRSRAPVMVGYSDFTAFNLAYLARGGVSFAGPCAIEFGAVEPSAFTIEHFFGVLGVKRYAIDLQLNGPQTDVAGRLWGGNLAMVTAMVGTPHFPRVSGGILFFEDVNEPAYKIERMFYQLAHAGVLQRQAAILLGDFAPVTPMPNDNGFDLDTAIERLREVSGVPVLCGLPFGHSLRKLTLPVGGRARLTVRRSGNATLELSRYPCLLG